MMMKYKAVNNAWALFFVFWLAYNFLDEIRHVYRCALLINSILDY